MYLIFLLLPICYLSTRSVQADDRAFVVTSSSSGEAVCVQTGDFTRSGLAWTISANASSKDVIEDKPQYDSLMSRVRGQLDFSCSFEDGDDCRSKWNDKLWEVRTSFEFPFAPRTDSAWNDLKVLFSKRGTFNEIPAKNKIPINFRELGDHNVSYISVSVKVANNAHVVFCDGVEFLSSRCYMVIISGLEGGRMSVIRKCVEGIPSSYPARGTECAESKASVTHDRLLVNDRVWSHFTFAINQMAAMTELRVFAQQADGSYKVILQYQDRERPIQLGYFGVKSYSENALWKIHNYALLRTEDTKAPGILYFGSGRSFHFSHPKDHLCLKMAVALCPTCSIQLHVNDDPRSPSESIRSLNTNTDTNTRNSHTVQGRDYNAGVDGLIPWREERFHIQFDGTWNRSRLRLYYSTTSETGTAYTFWAIDDIRECAPDENKILKFSGVYSGESCQMLDHDVTESAAAYDVTHRRTVNCSRWFRQAETCGEVSPIYHYTYVCSSGYNGDDCKAKTMLYTEFYIINSTYTNMTIRPKALNATGTTASYMKIQYQYFNKTSQGYSPWLDIRQPLPLSDYLKEFTIPADVAREYLISGQDLIVRIILYVDGERDYEGLVRGVNITSTCVQTKYKYTPEETSIKIMQEIHGSACPLRYYDIRIAGLSDARVHCEPDKEECTASGLQPYSQYSITYYSKKSNTERFRDNVTTKDGAPGPVVDLEQYSAESNSVSVRWKPPYQPPGVLQYYIINVLDTRNGPTPRTENITADTYCPLWEDYICHTIHQLNRDISYTLEVHAYTRNPNAGMKASILRIQLGQTPPSEPSDLRMKNVTLNQLSWRHPNYPNGKIKYFEITPTLKSTELKTTPDAILPMRKTITEDQREYSHMVAGLAPASTYTVKVAAYNEYKGQPAEIEVTTPLVPPDVTGGLQVQKLAGNELQINIPPGGTHLTRNSGIYVIVSEVDSKQSAGQKGKKVKVPDHKNRFGEIWSQAMVMENKRTISWVAKMIRDTESAQSQPIIIGTGKNGEDDTWDGPLSEDSTYTISVVYYNELSDGSRAYTVLKNGNIMELESNYALWSLLLLLLIPIIGYVVFKLYQRKKADKPRSVRETQYTPMSPQTELQMEPQPRVSAVSLPQGPLSHPVPKDNFENYVKESLCNGELERQHSMFERGLLQPVDVGSKKKNKNKNRYINLLPYDDTRVILQKLPHDPCSDYINANYIDGYERPKEYIAAQGPKENTTNDFWRMVWQEKVSVICMLTNIREGELEKCHQYWPALEGDVNKYGEIIVEHVRSEVTSDYVIRTFKVSHKGLVNNVKHLHFTSWSDHGVPQYTETLVSFIKLFDSTSTGNGPKLVHCSAGVGRTGTIILSDICLKMAQANDHIDVLVHQDRIRKQRANLVDNKDQYKLVHMIIVESLFGESTSIPCDELAVRVKEMKQTGKLSVQFKNMDKVSWKDNYTKCTKDQPAVDDSNKEKNRNEIIPDVGRRLFLSRFPLSDVNSDYINAVYVDGFQAKDQFIVTQFPLVNTIADYWRMVSDKEVSLVVVLNEIDERDKTIQPFIPNQLKPKLSPIPEIIIQHKKTQETESFYIIEVDLSDNTKSEKVSRNVEVLLMKHWKTNQILPAREADPSICLLDVLDQTDKQNANRMAPILVTCFDGATACGVFTALSFITEKIKLQWECDVPLAIRTIRRNRRQMLRSEEQHAFLYDAAIHYLGNFEIYSNFTR